MRRSTRGFPLFLLFALACRHTAPAAEHRPLLVVSRTISEDSLKTVPLWVAKPGHEPAFFEFQVETRVRGVPGNPQPTYPPELQAAGVGGRVLAQFVVDTAGRAEAGTYTILDSTDPALSHAVLENLPRMRFYPARIRGRKVRQVVQLPFTFSIGP